MLKNINPKGQRTKGAKAAAAANTTAVSPEGNDRFCDERLLFSASSTLVVAAITSLGRGLCTRGFSVLTVGAISRIANSPANAGRCRPVAQTQFNSNQIGTHALPNPLIAFTQLLFCQVLGWSRNQEKVRSSSRK